MGKNFIDKISRSKVHKNAFDLFHLREDVRLRFRLARDIIKRKIRHIIGIGGMMGVSEAEWN